MLACWVEIGSTPAESSTCLAASPAHRGQRPSRCRRRDRLATPRGNPRRKGEGRGALVVCRLRDDKTPTGQAPRPVARTVDVAGAVAVVLPSHEVARAVKGKCRRALAVRRLRVMMPAESSTAPCRRHPAHRRCPASSRRCDGPARRPGSSNRRTPPRGYSRLGPPLVSIRNSPSRMGFEGLRVLGFKSQAMDLPDNLVRVKAGSRRSSQLSRRSQPLTAGCRQHAAKDEK